MAGNGRKKVERLVPGVNASKASRVSKAAGSLGSSQTARMEQRATSSRSNARPRASNPSSPRRTSSSKATSQQGSATRKKGGVTYAPLPTTADSRLINQVRGRWDEMQPHEQQRFLSILLLILTCVLLGALTLWHGVAFFRPLADFFYSVFSWATLPVALGLLAFAGAHLIEGTRNIRFIRWSLVLGLLVLIALLLTESQLLLGNTTGGIIGGVLATPLLTWGIGAHILILGLLVVVTLLTFRVTLSQIQATWAFLDRVFVAPRASQPPASRVSPFLGQRPRFSRYSNNQVEGNIAKGTTRRPTRPPVDDEDLDDDDEIVSAYDDDGDVAHDEPRQESRRRSEKVAKGPRAPHTLNRAEHQAAVKGARQLPLPETPPVAEDELEEMEPLAPNPHRAPQPRITRRAAHAAKAELASSWKLPDISLLNHPEDVKLHILGDDTDTLAKTIQDTLRSFRVEAEVRPEDISIGPTVIRFGIRPTGKPMMKADEKGRPVPVRDTAGNIVYEARTRVSRIMALQNDLALVLESKTIRMEAPVPGRPYVGVEIPNKQSRLVTLREILESKEYQAAKSKSRLAVALGKDVAGAVRVGDLARMPHLLIAGATGSGKSVMINAIISSIITQATPDDVRLLMVDPKMVELSMYNGIPHLLSPVVVDVEKVVGLLKIAIKEMERRYRLFSQLGVRNLDGYRKLRVERIAHGDETLKNLPAIVIIIDELADLMMAAPEEVEGLICRLAQLARATGIHLVVATQRPSVDVITGLIKANIPTRISFMVSSAVDSRTIIDMGGAERLLGRGDMLYLPADAGKPERIQAAFVADEEAERLVTYWREQARARMPSAGADQSQVVTPGVEPGWEVSEQADEFELEDELLDQAEQVVQEYERASISLLQRRLKIGYARAARLIDLLEERGTISKAEPGGRAREVLEARSSGSRYHGGKSEGRTLADEAAEIMEEEKLRLEALKKQAEREGQ